MNFFLYETIKIQSHFYKDFTIGYYATFFGKVLGNNVEKERKRRKEFTYTTIFLVKSGND